MDGYTMLPMFGVGMMTDLDLIRRRAENREARAIERERRHAGYRRREREKNRAALKAMGLSTNVKDWPDARAHTGTAPA